MIMVSVSCVEEAKRVLLKDVHKLASLGFILEDTLNCGFMVHPNFE